MNPPLQQGKLRKLRGYLILALFLALQAALVAIIMASRSPHAPTPFPHVKADDAIQILTEENQGIDGRGDVALTAALNDLRPGHFIDGRSFDSIDGTLFIAGDQYSFHAAPILSATQPFRATVKDAAGHYWEGEKLGELLFTRLGKREAELRNRLGEPGKRL